MAELQINKPAPRRQNAKVKLLTGEEFHEWNCHGDGGMDLWEFQQQGRQLAHHSHTHLIGTDRQRTNTAAGTLRHQAKLQRMHQFRLQPA